MNVLFFSRFFSPHIGGVEKHILEISRLLIKQGHKVTIITEELPRKKNPRIGYIDSIKIYRIPVGRNNWFKKFRIWKEIWEIRNLIKTSSVVHCHDVFFWYLPFRFLYFNKPVFTTFHGYESYPLSPKSVFMHKISERLSRGNICIGHFIKKWYGTKADYIAYGGVNIVKSEQLKVKSSKSAIFIGRLDEQTGILTYVKAIKLIRKKIPDFKFEIIGDGKFRKEIEKDFRVLGFQKNSEKYFSKYHFAFVSRYLSILEALAAKRLVFAVYDNPLKEDYLRMSPFAKFINTVSFENELAEKVLHFLKNPREEKAIINEAFEWVIDRTWEEMTNTYLKLWRV